MPLYQDLSTLSGISRVKTIVGTKVMHVMSWSGAWQTVPLATNTCLHFILHSSSMLAKALYSLNWTARHLTYAYSAAQYWLSGENFVIYLCCLCIWLSYILCNSQQHLSRSFLAKIGNGIYLTRECSLLYNCFLSLLHKFHAVVLLKLQGACLELSSPLLFSAWQQSLMAVACIFSISFSAMAKKLSKTNFYGY